MVNDHDKRQLALSTLSSALASALGFAIGYILAHVLDDVFLGITPEWPLIVALVVLVGMLVIVLRICWARRR